MEKKEGDNVITRVVIKPVTNYFKNLVNVKKNLDIVKQSPVAALKYRFMIQKAMIVLLCLFFLYSFVNLIIKYNGGSSAMTLVGRGIMLLILVLLITKSFDTLKPLKKAIQHYELHPQHNVIIKEDVRAEIDEILENFNDEDLKGGNGK